MKIQAKVNYVENKDIIERINMKANFYRLIK